MTALSRDRTGGFDVERLRLAVYRAFADDGRVPASDGLAERMGMAEGEVRTGLRQLASARHLVLDDQDRILMAHPFSAVPMGFSVMGERTLWWGGCAWDSFALPHLLGVEQGVLVATRCRCCDRPHAWNVSDQAPPPGDQVAHFLVPRSGSGTTSSTPATTSGSSAHPSA
ncbi:organomercurial lyase [Actinomadura sp. NPDC047616]|uniref:organomercurial lyase n=1 Tax=Actinomadura sp. NPDC047616 TaxID=3155914 RepID=UPI0033D5C90D